MKYNRFVGKRNHWTPNVIVVPSGHEGDDVKPYQEKAVQQLLRKKAEAAGS